MQVDFDEATHTYRHQGAVVPSVTQILKALPNEYVFVDPDVLERAALVGQAVHRLIELDVLGEITDEVLEQYVDLLPYLDQFREFRIKTGFQPLASEQRVYSARYGYAGTLDLFGVLNGELALIDAKRTAAVPRTAGPQTAGYENALRECLPHLLQTPSDKIKRFALHLTATRWQLVPFTSPADLRVFLSALTIHQWSNQK